MMWAVHLILWVISLVLNVGPSFPRCTTSVSVKDFGCHLHWNCSALSTTTTFTVQTKIQGAEWQNVSECVQINSSSCDLSEVFTELDLYKFVRLELNHGHGERTHTSSQLCDPVKEQNAKFSPPSLTLSLKDQQLWVKVNFPCAPKAICQDDCEDDCERDNEEEICCPVTDFLPMHATVTLYNKRDPNDIQVKNASRKLQFGEFTSGQEYCAVAYFASSPLSNPQCVHVPPLEYPNLFILVPCGAFIALFLIVGFVLRRWCWWCASRDVKLPKLLMSIQSEDQEVSVVDEPDQAVFEEEETFVHLSIISLTDMLPANPSSFYPHFHGLGERYYTTATLNDRFCDKIDDTNCYFRDLEPDGLADCACPTPYPWPRWSSLPALKTGVVCFLGNLFPEVSGIPLSSVRVAEEQIAKMESDHSFTVLPTIYSDRGSSSIIC